MAKSSSKKPINLHLGCGINIAEGWINVDNNTDNNIELKKLDLNWDLRNPLPYKSNTVDKIFHEHFIEHLLKADGEAFLRQCYMLLKPGGTMRIGWPDTAKMVRAYLLRDKKYYDYISKHVENGMLFNTWDELLVGFFYSWEHRYGYTRKHLKQLLLYIGFKEAKVKKFMQSDYGYNIDIRNDPATTYIEVVK
ncbi:MAG TPA: methyltransferase domain-containing protein [Candidatus Saccharimonadales bacterium]|jgi:predicted SAM-dependent methyltransferase|nr:methyltransferase domain-containing protein [Candidatus Saccharimonadales bacterium]